MLVLYKLINLQRLVGFKVLPNCYCCRYCLLIIFLLTHKEHLLINELLFSLL
jgi:hypothetical protein